MGRLDEVLRLELEKRKLLVDALGYAAENPPECVVYLFDGADHAVTAIVVAPIAILAYVKIAGWFISRCHHLLPAVVNGAFVGLAVGCVTGLLFLIMAGTLEEGLLGTRSLQDFAGRVADAWGTVVIGCSLVCIPIGVIRGLMKTPWYDM